MERQFYVRTALPEYTHGPVLEGSVLVSSVKPVLDTLRWMGEDFHEIKKKHQGPEN